MLTFSSGPLSTSYDHVQVTLRDATARAWKFLPEETHYCHRWVVKNFSFRKTSTMKKLRRLWRRIQYIHPTKRHIVLITICFWLSGITLWTIRKVHNNEEQDGIFIDENNFVVYEHKDPFNTVVHQTIAKWHQSDPKTIPKLFPHPTSKWRTYPENQLFAWHEVPLHSVRATVDNNKTYLGEMGVPVVIPKHLEASAKERQSVHQLNVVASELVSLNRRLPDIRHER